MSAEELRREDDAKMAVLENDLKHVIDNQSRYEVEARDWRERFCKKLDILMDKLDARPCVQHEALLSSVKSQMAWLWAVTGGVVLAIIAEWVRK